MPLNGCLLVARVRRAEDRVLAERRIDGLVDFYAPLGEVRLSVRWVEALRLLVGMIRFDGSERDPEAAMSWGSELPAELASPERLLAAGDAELCGLPGPLAAVAAGDGRARLVTSPGGVTSLYAAASDDVEAWSSHAVAAGWLATGAVGVDAERLPELLSAEFVGDDRTLLSGVRAVPAAQAIEFAPTGAEARSFWPPEERWAPLEPGEARERAEAEFLAGLERRVRSAPHPVLGLTAGVDSRAVAVALAELGVLFSTFTFGDPDGEDAREAARVASALGVEHVTGPFEWWEDEDGLRRLHFDVRWTEGSASVGFGRVPWPSPLSHWIAGIGAETGRAFYYRWARPGEASPSVGRLLRALSLPFEARVVGARADVRRALRARWRGWIEQALALGHDGWRALDVVYAEQRVRRWGRAMAPPLSASLVPAFATPELLRALAWLPLEDRLEDGFHRRFLARRPELAPPPRQAVPRALIPTAARRAAALRARSVRRALGLRSLARRDPAPWFTRPPWDERPRFIEWLSDGVLDSALVRDAMGERWARDARERFLRGDPGAGELANWAAGPVALSEALTELRAR